MAQFSMKITRLPGSLPGANQHIHGLQQIRFNKGKIAEKFEEILATLEREGLVPGVKSGFR